MDLSTLDWGAIATILAAGVAWLISREWRAQKRSEILSNIAKEAYAQRITAKDSINNLGILIFDIVRHQNSFYSQAETKIRVENLLRKYSSDVDILVTNLDILAKNKSDEKIAIVIPKILQVRSNIRKLMLNIYGNYISSKQLTLKQENDFIKQMVAELKNFEDIIDSTELGALLVKYILHTK